MITVVLRSRWFLFGLYHFSSLSSSDCNLSMSQNTGYYTSTGSSAFASSTASHHRNKRISSHQTFLPTPSECDSPSSIVNTLHTESPSPPSLTVRIRVVTCSLYQNAKKMIGWYDASLFFTFGEWISHRSKKRNEWHGFDLRSPIFFLL